LQQVWDEMAKPAPDQALIARLTDQTSQHRLDYQREMTGYLVTFLATLSPEQRSRFTELAFHRPQGHTFRLSIP